MRGSALASLAIMTSQRDKATSSETKNKMPEQRDAGSERARDEQRVDAGPQHGGASWRDADRRDDDGIGKPHDVDAEPSKRAAREAADDDDEDPELAAAEANGEIESGAQHAGMGRGDKPRKPKSEEK
jgi:hypothetical protein